jgi:hypothetical protein
MAIPWSAGGGRIVILMNRKTGLNLITQAATESVKQWAGDPPEADVWAYLLSSTLLAPT